MKNREQGYHKILCQIYFHRITLPTTQVSVYLKLKVTYDHDMQPSALLSKG